MATRMKTVKYAFPITTTTVADATVTNLSQITINLPEASKTFVSVTAELSFFDVITATGGTINEHRLGLRLGAAAYTTVTDLGDIVNTGENLALVMGPYNFTSHFTTNWTGTSMTCDAQVYVDQTTGTTLGVNNVCVILSITYEYDDTAATQIKTVHLPLESIVGGMPTTATNFGTNQIPQLTGAGGILPENSPVIRDYFFVIDFNTQQAATTDIVVSLRVDALTTTNMGILESALATGVAGRIIYKPADGVPATTAAHNLQMWTAAGSAWLYHPCITLVVTYEFTLAGTTRVLNSIQTAIEMPSSIRGATAVDRSRFRREFIITEPGTITLRQSAARMNYNVAASSTLSVAIGAQAFRAYTDASGVYAGGFCLQQRFDSGSAQGEGFTIARGSNTFTFDAYSTNTTQDTTNVNGTIYLNYESDVPSDGIGAASHTVERSLYNHTVATVDRVEMAASSFPIPETDYWLVGVSLQILLGQAAAANAFIFCAQRNAGEGAELGWEDVYADALQTDAEVGTSWIMVRARDAFRKCNGYADSGRMDIEGSRKWRFFGAGNIVSLGVKWVVTYHSMNFSVAGNLSGHDPALPTQLKLVRADTGEVIKQQTLAAGVSAFNITAHDNVLDYYVDAFQDATHVGRSATGKAV